MKPITIIGGGLAGLTLGIALRRQGVPVTVHEAGQYPRHRVCGEFLSGRGVAVLHELGLKEKLQAVGAREARTVMFFSGTKSTPAMDLPKAALCVSRYRLDELLATTFTESGGDLRTGSRYTDGYGEGVVRATGRQAQGEVAGWRWLGLKVHAIGLELAADLEMHLLPDAYVGLCRVEGNRVNICGLIRTKETIPNLKNDWLRILTGGKESTLTKKLYNVIFDKESFSSIAGLPIKPFQNGDSGVFSVGDSVAMIPPVTGNGMSLAVESAWQAEGYLQSYCRGERPWCEVQALGRQGYAKQYGGRLRWANRLQWGVLHPVARLFFVQSGPILPGLFRFGFGVTRG
jgi:flavin-dependent dehydrogenase